MAGPGDQMAAAANGGGLGASHADREQVIDALKAAFVQGRLLKDELDGRVGQALAAQTHTDLAALTADIPAGLMNARPSGQSGGAWGRPPVNMAVMWGAGGIIPLAVLAAGLPVLLPWALVLALVIIYETLWVAGFLWFDSRHQHPFYQCPQGSRETTAIAANSRVR
jgi:DUF1707 SHOCT-like domain